MTETTTAGPAAIGAGHPASIPDPQATHTHLTSHNTPHQRNVKGETHMSPRRGGPTPYLRLDLGTKAAQGLAVLELVTNGATIRTAAAQTGLSPSTAWRRLWWLRDYVLPRLYGVEARRLPPQRGTRACPRGRPWISELDGPGGPLHQRGTGR